MTRRPVTLTAMDLGRILVRVLDVIGDQGGDWDATEVILRREFTGEELAMALDTYAPSFLIAYEAPGGPAFLREMADQVRRRTPPEPLPRRRRWLGVAG